MAPKAWPPKGFPLVDGSYRLTDEWTIELPSQFARRIDNGSLVLWRPGLTIWLDAYGNDHQTSRGVRLREIRQGIAKRATAIKETADSRLSRLTYRLREASAARTDGDPSVEALHGFVFSATGHLQIAIYFDDDADGAVAAALVASVTAR